MKKLQVSIILSIFVMVAVFCEDDSRTLIRHQNEVRSLVGKLSDASQEVRSDAAQKIRGILSKNPEYAPGDHGEEYWKGVISQFKPDMTYEDVEKLMSPLKLEMTFASGGTYCYVWRLDEYWQLRMYFSSKNLKPDKIRSDIKPALFKYAMPIYVSPPENYAGTWITYYVNGQKFSESVYVAGKQEGLHSQFYDNGKILWNQDYVAGVPSGEGGGWHRNGKVRYTIHYDMGKKVGTWTHWYDNGRIQSECEYKNGKQDGTDSSWYENGKKNQIVHYRNGKKDGQELYWNESGKLLWDRKFKDGELISSVNNY